MRLTALLPPPPTPRTTMRAAPSRLAYPFIVTTVPPAFYSCGQPPPHQGRVKDVQRTRQGSRLRSQLVTALPIPESGKRPRLLDGSNSWSRPHFSNPTLVAKAGVEI